LPKSSIASLRHVRQVCVQVSLHGGGFCGQADN
jgi:ribosomal protein S9